MAKKRTTPPTPPTLKEGATVLIEGFKQNTEQIGMPPPPEHILSFIQDGFYAGAGWAMDLLLSAPGHFDVETEEGEAASLEYLKTLYDEINTYVSERKEMVTKAERRKNRGLGISSLRQGGSA